MNFASPLISTFSGILKALFCLENGMLSRQKSALKFLKNVQRYTKSGRNEAEKRYTFQNKNHSV
jgi:hypothetical protein